MFLIVYDIVWLKLLMYPLINGFLHKFEKKINDLSGLSYLLGNLEIYLQ